MLTGIKGGEVEVWRDEEDIESEDGGFRHRQGLLWVGDPCTAFIDLELNSDARSREHRCGNVKIMIFGEDAADVDGKRKAGLRGGEVEAWEDEEDVDIENGVFKSQQRLLRDLRVIALVAVVWKVTLKGNEEKKGKNIIFKNFYSILSNIRVSMGYETLERVKKPVDIFRVWIVSVILW